MATIKVSYLRRYLAQHFWLVLFLVLLVVAVLYYWYITLEPVWPKPTNLYSLLGDAFLSGQTYFTVMPNYELLNLPDPYSPGPQRGNFLWDTSLYMGKYYLYFGPTTGLLWAAIKFTTNISISDAEFVFAFSLAGTTSLICLLTSIASKNSKIYSRTGLIFCFAAIAFGTWLPFILRRALFYEAAIAGGYCLMSIGLLLLWHGIYAPKKKLIFFLLTSLCFGAAVASRINMVFNIGILILIWTFLYFRRPYKDALLSLACLIVPWAGCLAGLAYYNFVRFDSIFETGIHFQLTQYNQNDPAFRMMMPEKIIPNLYLYLLHPLEWKPHFEFPFFNVDYKWLNMPLFWGYNAVAFEPVHGLLTNSPFALWLFAIPFCWKTRKTLSTETRIFAMAIAMFCAVMLAFLSLVFYITQRYSIDFTPWFMLLSCITYLHLLSNAPTPRAKLLLLVLGGITSSYTCFAGLFSTYCGIGQCMNML